MAMPGFVIELASAYRANLMMQGGSNHSSCNPIVDDAECRQLTRMASHFVVVVVVLFLEVLQLVEEEFHSAQM